MRRSGATPPRRARPGRDAAGARGAPRDPTHSVAAASRPQTSPLRSPITTRVGWAASSHPVGSWHFSPSSNVPQSRQHRHHPDRMMWRQRRTGKHPVVDIELAAYEPAGRRRRGGRRSPLVLGPGTRGPRRIPERRTEPIGPRTGSDPVAQPARGRALRLRRTFSRAPAERARASQRDPRPRPLGHLGCGRSPVGPGRDGARAGARNPAIRSRSSSPSSMRCLASRPSRADDRYQRRERDVPLREWRASLPDRRDGDRRPGGHASPGAHGARVATSAGFRSGRLRSRERRSTSSGREPSARPGSTTRSRISIATRTTSRACSSSDRTVESVALWVDRAYGYLMVFTGDTLADVHRRSIAIEPMTCPPNAFRTGDSLVRLDPGHSHTGTWGVMPSG